MIGLVIVVMIAFVLTDVLLRRLAAQPSDVNNTMTDGIRHEYWNGFRNSAVCCAICVVAVAGNMSGKRPNIALVMPFVIIAYVYTKRQVRNSMSLLQASRRGSVASVNVKLHGGVLDSKLEVMDGALPSGANRMRVVIRKPSLMRKLRGTEPVPAQAFMDETGFPVAVQLHSGEVVMRL